MIDAIFAICGAIWAGYIAWQVIIVVPRHTSQLTTHRQQLTAVRAAIIARGVLTIEEYKILVHEAKLVEQSYGKKEKSI